MNKGMILIFLSIFFLSMISGTEYALGSFPQGKCLELVQTCPNCTFVNITQITHQKTNTTFLSTEALMTKSGTRYTYHFCNTTQNGVYIYDTYGDLDGSNTIASVDFLITPSGESGTDNLVFIIFIIVIGLFINLMGFFGRNETMTLLGGMFLLFLGVYLINNGIVIYRDTLTNYFSYLLIGWGFTSSMMAAYSWYQDM